MKLMPLEKFREAYFAEGCAPTLPTLRALIADGSLKGKQIGSKYYIDASAFETTKPAVSSNALVMRVLKSA